MGAESPNVILYDVNGQEMSVSNGSAIPAGTSALMIAGSDGTDSRFFTVDTSGRLIVVGAAAAGASPAGNPNLVAGSVTTSSPAYSTATINYLSLTTSGLLRIDGAYPVNATTPTTDIIFVGGAVTTANPAYTTGQLSAFSLTTSGQLRTLSDQGVSNTLANAWATELTDGTHGPVSVTAASTSAVAASPALVVSQTPNLPTVDTVSKATVNASANGNNTLIAGVGGETIRVFKVALVFSVGGTAIFQDGNSTALTGPLVLNAGATIVLDMDITNPWFLTSAGNAFVVNLAGGAVVGGVVYYTQS
jgi:hypothetical protein